MKFSVAADHQGTGLVPKKEARVVTSPTESKKENAQKEKRNFSLSAISDFIGEIKSELQRISWTSTDDLKTYVKVVVSVTFIFGMSIYGIDLIIQAVLHALRFVVHALFG